MFCKFSIWDNIQNLEYHSYTFHVIGQYMFLLKVKAADDNVGAIDSVHQGARKLPKTNDITPVGPSYFNSRKDPMLENVDDILNDKPQQPEPLKKRKKKKKKKAEKEFMQDVGDILGDFGFGDDSEDGGAVVESDSDTDSLSVKYSF